MFIVFNFESLTFFLFVGKVNGQWRSMIAFFEMSTYATAAYIPGKNLSFICAVQYEIVLYIDDLCLSFIFALRTSSTLNKYFI